MDNKKDAWAYINKVDEPKFEGFIKYPPSQPIIKFILPKNENRNRS